MHPCNPADGALYNDRTDADAFFIMKIGQGLNRRPFSGFGYHIVRQTG
jgi:hypothetical protein